jgi:hypothetical protein
VATKKIVEVSDILDSSKSANNVNEKRRRPNSFVSEDWYQSAWSKFSVSKIKADATRSIADIVVNTMNKP